MELPEPDRRPHGGGSYRRGPRASLELLRDAPFELLAIVHRPDLRDDDLACSGGAGQLRFIYGARSTVAASMTAIVEIPYPATRGARAWLDAWHELGTARRATTRPGSTCPAEATRPSFRAGFTSPPGARTTSRGRSVRSAAAVLRRGGREVPTRTERASRTLPVSWPEPRPRPRPRRLRRERRRRRDPPRTPPRVPPGRPR